MTIKPRPSERATKLPASDYMTVEEFCEKFGISRKTWATHRPYLAVIKFGNRILIERAEVDRYIQSLTAPALKCRGLGLPKDRI
jgi:excisionase family DNA binding protein